MADVVIFGVGDCASLAHFYLANDSPHDVVGFTVHREFLPASGEFEGLPVVAFDELESTFPPHRVSAFAPLSSLRMNRFREEVYRGFKERGYPLISYISSKATCFPNTQFGDNCFVLENATIQLFSLIGNNVVLWSGCHVGHHSTVGDHAFFAPHAVTAGHCAIGPYCFLGTNATIRDHVTLGEGTL
ncbi:MAG TPA: acetyltransferase, partial [Lacipirellulaceae bacterium]|nr:acetyltransferase [Lacipirellulaceae bacterium]